MTPCVIAAGLSRRAPGARHLPTERLAMPDYPVAGFPTHRTPNLKTGKRVARSGLRSKRHCATLFRCWGGVIWEIPAHSVKTPQPGTIYLKLVDAKPKRLNRLNFFPKYIFNWKDGVLLTQWNDNSARNKDMKPDEC